MFSGSTWLDKMLHDKKKKKHLFFIFMVKDVFGTCGLKTLLFGTSVSIRIVDGTWVLGKD